MIKRKRTGAGALTAAVCALVLTAAAPAGTGGRADVDWNAVSAAVGLPGAMQTGNVYRIDVPRSDLKVKVGSVTLKTSFALGGYLVFLPTGDANAMVMGDLVLKETEVQRVLTKLEQGGIDVTALHNHLLGEKPSIMYTHISAMGDAVKLAQALHGALAASKTPLRAPKKTAADDKVALNTAALDREIGTAGKVSGGVYKFSLAPKYAITAGGMTLPPSMGMSTAFAFQPLRHGHAAITGDFAMLPSQVSPVLRSLRESGIAIESLHSHMLDVQPAMFFMHFYATGNATTLARKLRAAANAGGV
jgi:hypothetical protein